MNKLTFSIIAVFFLPQFVFACGGSDVSNMYELLALAGIGAAFSGIAFFGLKHARKVQTESEAYQLDLRRLLQLEFFVFLVGWPFSTIFLHPSTLCFVMPNDAFTSGVVSVVAMFLICFMPIHFILNLVLRSQKIPEITRVRLAKSFLYLLGIGYAIGALVLLYLALVVLPKVPKVLTIPSEAKIALPASIQTRVSQ